MTRIEKDVNAGTDFVGRDLNRNISEFHFNSNQPLDKRLDDVEKAVTMMQISLFGDNNLRYVGLISRLENLISKSQIQNGKLVLWLAVNSICLSLFSIGIITLIIYLYNG